MAQRKPVQRKPVQRKPVKKKPVQRKDQGCFENEQTHNTFGYFEVGCTKEDATRAIISRLLNKAERERKVKCKGLTCLSAKDVFEIIEGKCVTSLDPDDLERVLKSIRFFPVVSKDCPQKVAWAAFLTCSDDCEYKSRCLCVPRTKFI